MIDVIPFKAEHFWAIDVQPAQAYVRDIVAPDYVESLEKYDSYTMVSGDKLLCCFGFIELYPTRAIMWGYLSATCGQYMTGITRIAHRLIAGLPHQRIEIEVDCEFEEGHKWARIMGFELEVERMRCFRMDGGDSALYALVRP